MIRPSIKDKSPLGKVGQLFTNRFGRVARHVQRLSLKRTPPFRNCFNRFTLHPGPDISCRRMASWQLPNLVNDRRSRIEESDLVPIWFPDFTDDSFGRIYSRIFRILSGRVARLRHEAKLNEDRIPNNAPFRLSIVVLVFACQKLQEFATGCVIRHMTRQVGFIIWIQKREQRATFIVDIVQDQLSWQ